MRYEARDVLPVDAATANPWMIDWVMFDANWSAGICMVGCVVGVGGGAEEEVGVALSVIFTAVGISAG